MTLRAERTDDVLGDILKHLEGVERDIIFRPIERRFSNVIPEDRKFWMFGLVHRKGRGMPESMELASHRGKKLANSFREWLATEIGARALAIQRIWPLLPQCRVRERFRGKAGERLLLRMGSRSRLAKLFVGHSRNRIAIGPGTIKMFVELCCATPGRLVEQTHKDDRLFGRSGLHNREQATNH